MTNLTVVYANEEPPEGYTKAIFLAGLTQFPSWRPKGIRVLTELGYDGVVFVPEPRGPWTILDEAGYLAQIEWEDRVMHMADGIAFWMPRKFKKFKKLKKGKKSLGLTSNTEWGRWEDSGKVVFGAPKGAYKVRYLLHHARKHNVPVAQTLRATLGHTIDLVGEGSWRVGGEREVPLFIWNMERFKQWYGPQRAAGNVLLHAKVLWTYGSARHPTFFWALWAEWFITAENRTKSNELVLSRPDISTTVLYRRADNLSDSVVVLIREFRTPTLRGYVWEVPGGSKTANAVGDARELAAKECEQEIGLKLEAERFEVHGARQLVATLSSHRAHLFSAELTEGELDLLRDNLGTAYGVIEDTERTYVEITTVGAIRAGRPPVDWSMLGMILQVLA